MSGTLHFDNISDTSITSSKKSNFIKMWQLWCIISIIGLWIAYLIHSAKKDNEFFESHGVFYFGNSVKNLLVNQIWGKQTFLQLIGNQYQQLKNAGVGFGGLRDFGVITYIIKDPLIMKHILVKDFDHFVNKRMQIPTDKFLGRMLLFMSDEEWKALRSKLSPTFTTGKIKRVFSLFDQSAQKLVKYFEDKMSTNSEIDLAEGYSKFTMDTIASAVCGIDSQAFLQDEASVFQQMGKKLQLQFSVKTMLKFMFLMRAPRLAAFFGLKLFGGEMEEFFAKAIKSSLKHRRETGEKRDDFIQLMLEAREGQLKLEESELDAFEKDAIIKNSSKSSTATSDLLDDDGIVANCVLFILAGFDTTQSLLLYAAYALALNQDVQDKLREEVETTLEENNGKFTYEGLQKMNYLDMVINETLRYYPPAPITDRGCTQDYKFPGTEVQMKKGEGIIIWILGLHHDEQFYPEPSKFKPERFEDKSKVNPYVFLPFGQGPRNCIGMRFALTEVKLAIAHLVHNFNIEPSAKTLIPMEFENASSLKPKGGKMWLALNKRS